MSNCLAGVTAESRLTSIELQQSRKGPVFKLTWYHCNTAEAGMTFLDSDDPAWPDTGTVNALALLQSVVHKQIRRNIGREERDYD